jgi:hypothetical protein
VDDPGIQYDNGTDGAAVHRPAKEEQQRSDRSLRISEELGGFSENWTDVRKTGRIFEYPYSSSKSCTEFQTIARLFEEPDGFSYNRPVLRKAGRIFEQLHGSSKNWDWFLNNRAVLSKAARVSG